MRHRHSEGATAIGSPSPHPQPSFEALEQTLDLGPQIVVLKNPEKWIGIAAGVQAGL
jgi:hypothetical protein